MAMPPVTDYSNLIVDIQTLNELRNAWNKHLDDVSHSTRTDLLMALANHPKGGSCNTEQA